MEEFEGRVQLKIAKCRFRRCGISFRPPPGWIIAAKNWKEKNTKAVRLPGDGAVYLRKKLYFVYNFKKSHYHWNDWTRVALVVTNAVWPTHSSHFRYVTFLHEEMVNRTDAFLEISWANGDICCHLFPPLNLSVEKRYLLYITLLRILR